MRSFFADHYRLAGPWRGRTGKRSLCVEHERSLRRSAGKDRPRWHHPGVISITSKSPYALAALIELYRLGDRGPVPIAELARRRNIPVQFLEQLFATLRKGGVLRSQRGVKGGYSFARSPAEITVLELVDLLDGSVGRGANGVFADAAEAARAVLAGATVAEVAEAETRAASAPMYHI